MDSSTDGPWPVPTHRYHDPLRREAEPREARLRRRYSTTATVLQAGHGHHTHGHLTYGQGYPESLRHICVLQLA